MATVTDPTRTPFAGPSLDEIEAARAIVSRVAQPTPMESSRYLTDVLGAPVPANPEGVLVA